VKRIKMDIEIYLDKEIKKCVDRLKKLKKNEFGTMKWKKIWDKLKILKELKYGESNSN